MCFYLSVCNVQSEITDLFTLIGNERTRLINVNTVEAFSQHCLNEVLVVKCYERPIVKRAFLSRLDFVLDSIRINAQ